MHDVLREESAQSTVEYAIVTVALLSIVLAIAGLWRAGHRVVLMLCARTGRSLRSRLPFCCRRF